MLQRGNVEIPHRDGTANADEFDFDSYHLVAGLDYQLNPNFVIGAAIGYFVVDSEFKVTSDVAGGDTEIDGFSVMGYFSWYSESFYVDGFAGLGTSDYDMTRHIVIPSATAVSAIDETAISSTDSDDYTVRTFFIVSFICSRIIEFIED